MTFEEWFDKEYPVEKMGLPTMRNAFKEVAEAAWNTVTGDLDNLYLETVDTIMDLMDNDDLPDVLVNNCILNRSPLFAPDDYLRIIKENDLKVTDSDESILDVIFRVRKKFVGE